MNEEWKVMGIIVICFFLVVLFLFSPFSEQGKIYEFCREKGFDGGHWHQSHGIECSKTTWHKECYSEDYCKNESSTKIERFLPNSLEK